MSTATDAILGLLADGPASSRAIIDRLEYSRWCVLAAIKRLRTSGKIQHTGQWGGVYYLPSHPPKTIEPSSARQHIIAMVSERPHTMREIGIGLSQYSYGSLKNVVQDLLLRDLITPVNDSWPRQYQIKRFWP